MSLNYRSLIARVALESESPPVFTPNVPQAVVWIDPQNRTGNAHDGNGGLLPTEPLRTWRQGVLPRFGVDPVLPVPTTFNFMSSSPDDGSDPITFSPTMRSFAGLRFNGTFDAHNLFGSGILAGVAAKNRATGQTLTANLSATPGAAVGMAIINTTVGKSSIAFIRADLGGNVFQITQPLTIVTNWPQLSPDPVEVDTWVNGDTYALYNEDLIDLVRLDARVSAFDVTAAQFTVITNLGVLKPSTSGTAPCYIADVTVFLYAWLQRRVNYLRPSFARNSIMFGCLGLNGIQGGVTDIEDNNFGNRPWLIAGAYGPVDCFGVYANEDIIFTSPSTRLINSLLGQVCVDTGAQLHVAQEIVLTDQGFGASIWGGGSIDVRVGRLTIRGTTAVASLLCLGGTTINGQANGFTATRANPSVVNGAVPITPANIDANPSGLFIPGGGAVATFG